MHPSSGYDRSYSNQMKAGPAGAAESTSTILNDVDPDTRECFHKARAYDMDNRFALAEARYAEITECLTQDKFRRNDVLFLFCVDRRAVMLTKLCKFNQALDLSREAWKAMCSCYELGRGHVLTLTCCGNLAKIYRQLGRPIDAQSVLESAFEATENKILHSGTTLWLLSIYAQTLVDQDEFAECQIRLRDTVRASHLLTEELGSEHVFTLRRESQLAASILDDNRDGSNDVTSRIRLCAVAEKILRRCLGSMVKLLGSRHSDTFKVARQLADSLRYQGKVDEAESIIKPMLLAQRKALHPLHPDTLLTTSSFAMIMLAQQKVLQAETILRDIYIEQQRRLGSNHPDTHLTSRKVNALDEFLKSKPKDSMSSENSLEEHPDTHRTLRDVLSEHRNLSGWQRRYTELTLRKIDAFDELLRLNTSSGMEFEGFFGSDGKLLKWNDEKNPLLGSFEDELLSDDDRKSLEHLWRWPAQAAKNLSADSQSSSANSGTSTKQIAGRLKNPSFIRRLGRKRSKWIPFVGMSMRLAAKRGDEFEVRRLVKLAPEAVNLEGGLWETPLAAACLSGNAEIVQCLLERKADPNARNGAALRNAARRGFLVVVKLLTQKGADVNQSDPILGTAIRAALSGGHRTVFSFLLKQGADLNLKSDQDVLFGTALQRAVLDGDIEITKSLLEKHADPNVERGYFGSAIELAATLQRPDILRQIFESAVPLDPTILERARRKASLEGQEDVMKCFLQSRAFDIQRESAKTLISYGSH